jgi:hypothetical protein
MNMDKEIRADAKLKNLPPAVLDELWRMRHPVEEQADAEEGEEPKVFKYVEILVWLKETHGVDSSLGALSGFYAWLRMERRFRRAEEVADQVRQELVKGNTYTAEDIEREAQRVFTAEALEFGDVKAFVALAKLRLENRRLDQDERRLVMLEEKERRLDAMESKAKELKNRGGLTAETLAILEKELNLL